MGELASRPTDPSTTVLLLLMHCPHSSSTCQTLRVSTYELPQLVYEMLDNHFWAFFKEVLGYFLCILKVFFLTS